MSKINFKEANEMYAGGMTYAAIAHYYGVTRQYVQAFMNSDVAKPYRKRKNSKLYDQIVYKGFQRLFESDNYLTVPKLAKMVMGYQNSSIKNKLTRMMIGHDVIIHKSTIDKLLEFSGMSYEQFFEKI